MPRRASPNGSSPPRPDPVPVGPGDDAAEVEYAGVRERRGRLVVAAVERLRARSRVVRLADSALDDDLGQVVDFLAAATWFGDRGLFADHVGWLARVSAARGARATAPSAVLGRSVASCTTSRSPLPAWTPATRCWRVVDERACERISVTARPGTADRAQRGSAVSEPLDIEAKLEGRSVCLVLSGELTFGTVPVFDERLSEVLGSSGPRLVVDVHGLQFCDSVGLSALIGAQRRAEAGDGRMVLRGVHGMLERVLRITGAGVLFTVVGGDLAQRADRAAAGDPDRAGELA